jgi:ABC-type transport system substrate-binding protein/class 3 adenylate cyclase
MEPEQEGVLRAFLIADVRGYTRFTQTRGDEAAAELAAHFARLTREVVTEGGGELVELRGDEALTVFASPRQAVRTAVEIQRRLRGAQNPDEALPLGVGIGIDAGEAVPVEGGWRGKALNVAARLCSLAGPGQINVTETVGALAGGVPGVRLVPRKPVRVKGIEQPVRLLEVVPDKPLPELRPLENSPVSRRRRLLVPAAVGAVVAAVAVVAVLVVGGSSKAGRLATNSVGIVDTAGHVHDVVAVGKGPSDVVADDKGALWVADEPGHALLRVDPNTHAVTQSFSLGTAEPTALAFGDGALWVLDSASRRLLRWAPDPGTIAGRYAVGNGPADVAFGAGAAWVPNEIDGTVTRVDATNGTTTTKTFGVGIQPVAAAFGAGALWVANAGGDNVARVDVASRTVAESIPVGHGPQAIAVRGSSVWVTSTADKTVWEIDAKTSSARRTVPLPDEPNALSAGAGGVWAASYRAGTVTRIENGEASTHDVGSGPIALSVTGDGVWVAAAAPDASHRGGTLRITGGFPATDPQFGSPGANVSPMLGDGLVNLKQVGGPSGTTLVPDLASAIPAPTDGGRTYTFHVRDGIRYSDGRSVKPSDFVFTFRRLFKLQDPGAIGEFYGSLAGADACLGQQATCDVGRMVTADDGAMTVTFHLDRPDPTFAESLAFPLAWVVPPGTPMKQLTTTLVPSTGPYRIAKVVPGKRMVLTRNPYFDEWSHDAQPTGYPERIVVTPSSDPAAEVRANRADAAAYPVLPEQVPELATRYPGRLHTVLYSKLLYVFLNTRMRPFDDVRVRRAVALAIDRRAIANRIGGTLLNQITCQVLPPNLLGFQPYCPWTQSPRAGVWTAPDLAAAKRMVAASGTRGMPVTVWRPVDDPWRRAALELEATLRRLGYRVNEHVVGGDIFAYFGRVSDPKAHAQAGPGTWAPDVPIPSQMISILLSCTSPPGLSLSHYCSRVLDAKTHRAEELQATSPSAAAAEWAKADGAVTDAAPIVPIAVLGYAHLVSDRVGNFQAHAQWGPIYDQMWVR